LIEHNTIRVPADIRVVANKRLDTRDSNPY